MPPLTEGLAEVIGVNIGDGCVSRTRSGHSFANVVAFTAHPTEYWYYETFVKPTIDSAFQLDGQLYLRRDHTTRLHYTSKKLVEYLEGLGLPVGKKTEASIPPEILKHWLVVPFIRGIYHAEGSIYRRCSKRYAGHARVYDNLLVIQIRMKLKTLMPEVRDELLKLGIMTNRLTDKDGVYTLSITSLEQIRKFIETIRPKYKLHPHPIRL